METAPDADEVAAVRSAIAANDLAALLTAAPASALTVATRPTAADATLACVAALSNAAAISRLPMAAASVPLDSPCNAARNEPNARSAPAAFSSTTIFRSLLSPATMLLPLQKLCPFALVRELCEAVRRSVPLHFIKLDSLVLI
ncbi:MAG TPA: hypothetical protein PKW87_07055 [Bacillota bacterium]|nr:hypothetical protein [Bacillota bacterium]